MGDKQNPSKKIDYDLLLKERREYESSIHQSCETELESQYLGLSSWERRLLKVQKKHDGPTDRLERVSSSAGFQARRASRPAGPPGLKGFRLTRPGVCRVFRF